MSRIYPLIRRRVVISLVLYAAASIVGGIGLGEMAMHPDRRALPADEVNKVRSEVKALHGQMEEVSIVAADGAILRGWFAQPASGNGNAVILLHGVCDNRLGMLGYGEWLLRNGYSVLLPDARAHGSSGGELATYGLKESDDIYRWVSWLEDVHHPGSVFAFGQSMGAAQILQALSKETRLCAVVAECPFESFREASYARFGMPFHTGPWLGRTFFRLTDEVGFLYVRLWYGVDMDLASPRVAVAQSHVPIFLIHGTNDRKIPSYNSEAIAAENVTNIVLWLVPGAGHCRARASAPEEFDRRILEWLNDNATRHVDLNAAIRH